MSAIHYLKQSEINRHEWDGLINASSNSLPYAFSWYLDAVAENWDALVWGDYEAVMPLVWLRKFGVKCLYQPYYCQQLGVFAKAKPGPGVVEELLKLSAHKFPYLDINLNPSASIMEGKIPLIKKKNLLLDIAADYKQLKKNYTENHRRNIAKAEKADLHFSEEIEIKAFQKFYLENVNREKENFKPKHEKIFKTLSSVLVEEGKGKIFASVGEGGKVYAATLMVFHQKRMIGIINTSSSAGKKNGASHFVFDQCIQKFAGQRMVVDFEGSSVPSIARFYEGFGAQEETFYRYKHSIVDTISQRFS